MPIYLGSAVFISSLLVGGETNGIPKFNPRRSIHIPKSMETKGKKIKILNREALIHLSSGIQQ
ncbi:MAG TPA: hypothetical protein DCR42_07800 [Flavobacteriaceae bacterium]|nr:hypothetical protein [Flavobacteriaceae bacterium]